MSEHLAGTKRRLGVKPDGKSRVKSIVLHQSKISNGLKILKCWPTAALCAVFLAFSVHAAELMVGSVVPAIAAKDQFGKEFKFSTDLRFLLVGFERGVNEQADQQLAKLRVGWLEQRKAAYLMDSHKIPSLVRGLAVHKMKESPERIILCDDKKLLESFPHKTDRITILALTSEGRIKDIRYWDAASEKIEDFLDKAPAQDGGPDH